MRQEIGQLFMVGLPGPALDDSTRKLIHVQRINNFILFKRNVGSPQQLQDLCASLRETCLAEGLGLPLISIDQEGGTVARLPDPFTQFVDARVYGDAPDPAKAVTDYASVCAKELQEVGINMNMAPVLDVCPTGQGFFMEKRALGDDPEMVGRLGALIIQTMQARGVAACGKHFPGLGAAKLDPHLELPVVERAKQQLEEVDLLPYHHAIQAGVAAVMTSHTIYTDIDPALPATISPRILTGLLRHEMGFDGLIITDDLEMGAIENERDVADAAYDALLAGADMLLICHDHEKVARFIRVLEDKRKAGVLSVGRLAASIKRINEVRSRFT